MGVLHRWSAPSEEAGQADQARLGWESPLLGEGKQSQGASPRRQGMGVENPGPGAELAFLKDH